MEKTFKINNKVYKIKDLSVLKKFNASNLKLKPYPHIVINNALDEEIYKKLENEFPSNETINELDNSNYDLSQQNVRLQSNSINALESKKIPDLWKLFIEYHTSREFFNEVRKAFGKNIIDNFDNIVNKMKEKNIKNVQDLTLGKRNEKNYDLQMDCQIGINTPCTQKSHVIGPHIDNLNEIYAGLFYMKSKEDKGSGGDLEIYETKKKYKNLKKFKEIIKFRPKIDKIINGRKYVAKREFFPDDVKVIKKIKYEKNTFVIFLCDINSIHGVSKRDINPISRRLINIICESYNKNNNTRF